MFLSCMDNLDCLFEDFPFGLVSMEKVHYNMFWSTKSGCKRALQYWVYCESNHDNYLTLELSVPGFKLNPRSCIMMGMGGELYVVEDIASKSDFTNVYPLFSSSPMATIMPKTHLFPVDYKKFDIKISLQADDEFPKHPFQEDASYVQSTIEMSGVKSDDRFPFLFTFRVNFQGRAEGWFKIQSVLIYDKKLVITQNTTEAFMFNNPRLKKTKEQKNYSTKELKFMLLGEISGEREKFLQYYGYLFQNAAELLFKAPTLFPNVKKVAKSKSRPKCPTVNYDIRSIKLK